jgi:uncharacterized OsmC-like protein
MIRKIASFNFAKVKALKLTGKSLSDGIELNSQTHQEVWESHSPLETFVGTVAACELSTLRAVMSQDPVKLKSVKFTRIESSYQTEKFKKGGK